jgi:ADP-ribosylglycohydrolase
MTTDETLQIALIMKYLWEKGLNRDSVKKAVDAWWDMKEKI